MNLLIRMKHKGEATHAATLDFVVKWRITAIKILAILYVGILFSVPGILLSMGLDRFVFGEVSPEADMQKSMFRLIVELSLLAGILAVVAYVGRNLLQLIPFPLDGMFGFEYGRVKEYKNATILATYIVLFSQTIQSKIMSIKEKLGWSKITHSASSSSSPQTEPNGHSRPRSLASESETELATTE